jgi:hypothetical protein
VGGDEFEGDVHFDDGPPPDGTRVDVFRASDQDTGMRVNPDGPFQIVRSERIVGRSDWWYRVAFRRVATD